MAFVGKKSETSVVKTVHGKHLTAEIRAFVVNENAFPVGKTLAFYAIQTLFQPWNSIFYGDDDGNQRAQRG